MFLWFHIKAQKLGNKKITNTNSQCFFFLFHLQKKCFSFFHQHMYRNSCFYMLQWRKAPPELSDSVTIVLCRETIENKMWYCVVNKRINSSYTDTQTIGFCYFSLLLLLLLIFIAKDNKRADWKQLSRIIEFFTFSRCVD